jgi:hypothetical protein
MSLCRYHPDRPGIGVCVRCRVVICAECCTRLDGVNHCHACLKELGQGEAARSGGISTGFALACIFEAWLVYLAVAWFAQGWLAP